MRVLEKHRVNYGCTIVFEGLSKQGAFELDPQSPNLIRGGERAVSTSCGHSCCIAPSHRLGFPVGELGVTAAAVAASHEAEDSVPVAAREFVSQLKGKLVASLSRASVWLSGVGLRAAQGGCQLSEGRV